MRVALFGEGKNDFGYFTFDKKNCRYWEEGAIQPLLRNFDFFRDAELIAISKEEIKEGSYIKGKREIDEANFKGVALKLLKFIKKQRSKIKDYNFIVFYSDCDKDDYNARYQQINTALQYIFKEYDIEGIVMMPHRILENWLLGCQSAYEKIFGKIPNNPELPKKPEELWGDKESPNFPKNKLAKVLEQFHKEPNTVIFKEITGNIDIEELRLKCPISFASFCVELEKKVAKKNK